MEHDTLPEVTPFFRKRTFLVCLGLAVLANGANWVFIALFLQPKLDPIPIHYNIYFGIDLVGPWWYFFFYPAVGTAVIFCNVILSMILSKRESFAGHILVFTNLAVQIMLLLAGYLAVTQL